MAALTLARIRRDPAAAWRQASLEEKAIVVGLGALWVYAVVKLARPGAPSLPQAEDDGFIANEGFEPYAGNPEDGRRPVRLRDGSMGWTLTPSGPRFAVKHLPGEWGLRKKCQFLSYLRGLLARHGVTGRAATLFIAHLARETGYGRAVYNYAFGNIKAPAAGSPWHRLSDGLAYKAYRSADEGIADSIAFLRDRNGGRYRAAWNALMAGDPGWYSLLGLAGYYEYVPRDPVTGARGTPVRHTPETIGVAQRDYNAFLRSIEACDG